MTINRTRSISLALTILVATFSALLALALSGGHDASAHGDHAVKRGISAKELALRNDLRRLWEDHVTWTRMAIVSLTTNSPDTKATVARLLRNQADIGNAVKPLYGAAAGRKLTTELRTHILIAADLIAAAKAGKTAEVTRQQRLWRANAFEIAALLHGANPRFWPLTDLRSMMLTHLGLTTNEVLARLGGRWADDVEAYDAVHAHILQMSDMLAEGIVRQFPGRFGAARS
jgi:hypothetical protein